MNVERVLIFPFFCLLIAGLVLPSDGNHGLLSPKTFFFLLSSLSLSFLWLTRLRFKLFSFYLVGFTLLSICFLTVWLFIGLNVDEASAKYSFDQFKVFAITLAFVIMALFLVKENLVSASTFFKTTIFANFGYSCAKVILVVGHFLGVFNMWTIMEATGFRFMSMAIVGDLGRLQTSVDIITPYLIFFVLQKESLNLSFSSKFCKVYLFISILSVFLSFSRFLIMAGFLAYFLYWVTLSARGLAKGIVITLVATGAIIAIIGPDTIGEIIHQRFMSTNNRDSDDTRKIQVEALLKEQAKYPLLGKGLGGYTEDLLRDVLLKYSYEVQWVAFYMQFGLIGLVGLCVPLVQLSVRFFKYGLDRVGLSFFGMFCMWLFSGFTNPYLISLTSGIVYALFYLAADLLHSSKVAHSYDYQSALSNGHLRAV